MLSTSIWKRYGIQSGTFEKTRNDFWGNASNGNPIQIPESTFYWPHFNWITSIGAAPYVLSVFHCMMCRELAYDGQKMTVGEQTKASKSNQSKVWWIFWNSTKIGSRMLGHLLSVLYSVASCLGAWIPCAYQSGRLIQFEKTQPDEYGKTLKHAFSLRAWTFWRYIHLARYQQTIGPHVGNYNTSLQPHTEKCGGYFTAKVLCHPCHTALRLGTHSAIS